MSSDPDGGYCGDRIVQTAYEQCDLGESVVKRADVVFIFDISGSMKSVAYYLCNSLGNTIASLNNSDIQYRLTIMPMGDNSVLTTNDASDDIDTIFNDQGNSGLVYTSFDTNDTEYQRWNEHVKDVFDYLVTNCSIYQNITNYPNVRYRSYYSIANNDINNDSAGLLRGSSNPAQCLDTLADEYAGNIENWGPAIDKIVTDYNWLDGYQRIVVPVSQDYAWCGNGWSGTTPILNLNEDFVGDATSDILVSAVNRALLQTPAVRISPILFDATYAVGTTGYNIASNIAERTSGLFSNQTPDSSTTWGNNIVQIINTAFCDGNGDGVMDCSFP